MLPELPDAKMETRKPIEVSPKFGACLNTCAKQIFTIMAERSKPVNEGIRQEISIVLGQAKI
jgi:hypothetical protein